MAEVVFGTSGSTGASKRIVRTEESLLDDARRLVAEFPEVWSAAPAVVASIRPEHMYGALWRVRAPAVAGSAVDPAIVFSVEELFAARERYGRFLFVTTPSFLEKALAHPDFAALKGAFHAIVTSGSLLRGETSLAVLAAVGCCPLEIYGSTETGTVAWRRRREGEEWTLVSDVRCHATEDGRMWVDSPFAMERPYVMGDLVEFVGERRFLLKGRADRRVKILEKYVSLSEVESALAAHPYVGRVRVEPYGEEVVRLGALIVPSAAGLAVFARDGSSAVATELRAFLRGVLAAVAVPRRFRLVREFPTNEQGKTTVAAVRAALGAWCREPAVLSWQATADTLAAKLVFPADTECFKGHFPGFPILPGVAQLYFLRHFAQQAFPDWPETPTYRRLKFQKVVLPNREITLVVTRQGTGEFAFTLDGPSGRASSGLVQAAISDGLCH